LKFTEWCILLVSIFLIRHFFFLLRFSMRMLRDEQNCQWWNKRLASDKYHIHVQLFLKFCWKMADEAWEFTVFLWRCGHFIWILSGYWRM
jgi:hypothetical protein